MAHAQEIQLQIRGIPEQESGHGENGTGPKADERRSERDVRWWTMVVADMFLVLCGQTAGTLLGRLYYNSGGNSKWMATLAQSGGSPLLAILLFLTPPPAAAEPQPAAGKMVVIYVGLGIIIGFDNLMYSYALQYLPVSTFSLVAATQLAFNSITSRLINAQRFTALIANSVVVLTFSAALLGVGSSSDETSSNVPRGKYPIGFVLTLSASATFALILSLFEVTFEKVVRTRTFRWVLRVVLCTNIVASLVSVAGLFASGDWRTIPGEMAAFKDGRARYVATLVGTAVSWQAMAVGALRAGPVLMAGQPRDRAARAARKSRAARTGPAAAASSDPDPSAAGAAASEDAAPWGRATADELEERLLKKLEDAYAAALARLADLGFAEDAALRAVLRAGHCYGRLDDPVANIVANARAFLSDPDLAGRAGGFADLRRLEEYSLAGLVCLLQSSRPTLSRAEAMWCLLSTDLRLEQAISMGASLTDKPSPAIAAAESDELPPAAPGPGQRGYCHYHATTAAATPDTTLFDPETFMRLAMSQNPATAAGVVSCIKTTWSRSSGAAPDGQPKQTFTNKLSTEELIESVVVELESLNIDKKDPSDAKPDPKNEMVRDLIKQTREMEALLKERKEWAQQKAIQAARKLGTDLTELRVLRMEHDENQRRKKEKQAMEDETMKRLTHLENELKRKSGQLDRSNATVQRLEMENAEIRAEMEAAKLSASESERQCQMLLRKEKKDSKRLELWERQKAKLQEEIAECKTKITQTDRELAEVNKAIKNMENKIRENAKATEENLALAEHERGKRESAKGNADRRLEEIRQKTEVESRRHKDDLRRLQDELTRLQKSMGANQPMVPSNHPPGMTDQNTVRAPKQPNQRPPPTSNRPQEPTQKTSRRRDCVICKREEACVILLECAHQVLCVGCNKRHEEKGAARCPSCNAKIEERIRVFGATSN